VCAAAERARGKTLLHEQGLALAVRRFEKNAPLDRGFSKAVMPFAGVYSGTYSQGTLVRGADSP
jgi:hypothetical protein